MGNASCLSAWSILRVLHANAPPCDGLSCQRLSSVLLRLPTSSDDSATQVRLLIAPSAARAVTSVEPGDVEDTSCTCSATEIASDYMTCRHELCLSNDTHVDRLAVRPPFRVPTNPHQQAVSAQHLHVTAHSSNTL